MTAIAELVTENIGNWTSAAKSKASTGKGAVDGVGLYGIGKLRGLILDLAVRGLLAPQTESDEPSALAIERGLKEREVLVAAGKMKKPATINATMTEPYSVPIGWSLSWLSDVTLFQEGPGILAKDFRNEGVALIRIAGMSSSEVSLEGCNYLDQKMVDAKWSHFRLDEGDTLLSSSASLGKVATVGRDAQGAIAYTGLIRFKPFQSLHGAYLRLFFKSPEFASQIEGSKTGAVIKHFGPTHLKVMRIPVPPVEEQLRIVTKVEELMLLCDQLEAQQADSIEAHKRLVTTLLDALTKAAEQEGFDSAWARIAEHFDVLFTTEWSIDQLKQTILQLAVTGKLVPHQHGPEQVKSELVALQSDRDAWLQTAAESNPEAKTMLRKLKALTPGEPMFALPSGWAAPCLIELTRMLVDCHNKTAPYVDEGIPIIRTTNIKERQYTSTDQKYVAQETYDYWSRRCPPESGDLIFTREAPMGEALIIPDGAKWCLGQRTMLIRPMHQYVSKEYLLYVLTEASLLARATDGAVGMGVKHLRVGDVESLQIPLPPREEQHRIVEKIDELLSICDALKSAIQEAQQTQLLLADAITEHAVA